MAVEPIEELREAASTSPRLAIVREELTYEPHKNASYVKDFVRSAMRGDQEAETRLQRHAVEMRTVVAEREAAAYRASAGVYEARAVSWIAGTGGYFAPPLWIIEQFATAPRPLRVLARLVPQFPLPVGPQTINLPRLTTGTTAGAVPLNANAPERSVLDSSVTSVVTTIAGNADVPMQMIEQSPLGAPFDWVIFSDLVADYDYQLETQILNGSGSAQLAGIIPSSPSVSYTDSTPTATEMIPFLGQTMAFLSNARRIHMQGWLMQAGRFAWLATSEDQQQRPLLLTDYLGSEFPVSSLAGFGVYLDEAIPETFGAGGNQDVIIALRWDDMLLMESDPRMQVMPDVLSGSLDVRLQLRGYCAFLNRYPSSVATLGGTGLVVQSGY